ncbi:fibrinogen-like YCDxxxxGGGW domain-containing protein [Leucobacter luti]|uniref:fibrinogen-like YCDxxxxGGGW domain-containing protein n=1 Tax=Leucobacter luti TaxID=340320 RepID=UPI003CFCD391
MRVTSGSRGLRRTLATLVALGVGATVLGIPPGSQPWGDAASAAARVDGSTEATAAASCWEIKQEFPRAKSGVYWLSTPEMVGPEQFYCDQEREGGGWVLIGRGREGWSAANAGVGEVAEVRSAVTGPSAFSPRQLSSETIGELLGGQRVDQLQDGVRLVRAKNQGGTSWQEASFTFATPRGDWSWQFENDQRVRSFTIDGRTRSGGVTRDFGSDSSYRRVSSTTGATQGWQGGFGFGRLVRGNPSDSSYLWSKDTRSGYARPFTQVYLRPKLKSGDLFAPIPDSGTPARTGTTVVDSLALPQPWSVTGLGAGPQSLEGFNEAAAFTESGGRVFVGGNFTAVQRTAAGAGKADQRYLAAFDRDSGEWDPAFRPRFDNAIRALAELPGGRVAVGGYFTRVNDERHQGLVVLDAVTGEIDRQFTGRLVNRLSGGVPIVRALDVQGDWLYVAGSFTHGLGGTVANEQYMRAAGRFSVHDGTPDHTWNPELNGTVVSIDASEREDRVYLAGYFTASRGRTANKAAAVTAVGNDLFTWRPQYSASNRSGYQQAVLEVGDRVWLAGSEHSLFSFSRDDFTRLSGSIGLPGGDFQALAAAGDAVYGGCHCFGDQYEGAFTWPNVGSAWSEVNPIWGTGAWDAATGERITGFNGSFSNYRGAGSWALFVDSAGTLWQGGDYSHSTDARYAKQWSSGFTRQPLRDSQAPSTPARFGIERAGDELVFRWDASSDDRGVKAYQLLREDRVLATVTGTEATLPAEEPDARYFVRAIDARGNASASTAATRVGEATEPDPESPEPLPVIDAGSEWSFAFSAKPLPADWAAPGFDDSAWDRGPAPFGWGHADIATKLEADTPKPLVSVYRKTFEIEDAAAVSQLRLTTRADDGIVVYVNGAEVGRANVSDPLAGHGSYADSSPNAQAALAHPVVIDVPAEQLRSGANTIAVSVHSGYRLTSSHSFELEAVAVPRATRG